MTRKQKGLTYLVVGPFAIVLAFPFYFALITTFNTDLDGEFHWDFWNYATTGELTFLFTDTNYELWLLNTLLVGLAVVAITLVLAMPAGYALARLAGGSGQ